VVADLLAMGGAGALAWLVDRRAAAAGLLPPSFETWPWRRWVAGVLLFLVLWTAVTGPLATFGLAPEVEAVPVWTLFLVHALLFATMIGWLILGFAGSGRAAGQVLRGQVGLRFPDPKELAIGIVVGVAAWLPAIVCSAGIALGGWAIGWIELDAPPPAFIPWLVGQTVMLRVALALSAGFFEEIFFRGFLQPRIGVAWSTILFVLAHAGYGQLPLLGGVTFLSLVFAGLVVWRRSLEAAIAAHATFDVIQLLVVMPLVLQQGNP
jgi:membrane protease YdiL (CAAX protease family)